MSNNSLLQKAKITLRINSTAFDEEIVDLIDAAKLDLGIAGVILPTELDPLTTTAVMTYVRAHFGQPEDYDRIKKSYDEQKAQLKTATGFTDWGGANV